MRRTLRPLRPVTTFAAGVVLVLGTATATPAPAAPSGAAATGRVIVLLRSPATGSGRSPEARSADGSARVHAEDAAVDQVRRHGGRVDERYSLIAGFSATVSPAAVTALQARSDVAAVVPDRLVHLPSSEQPGVPRAHPTTLPTVGSEVCPSDPAKPLLAPEALSIMRAASTEPSTPSAAGLATGAGVVVGVIGNGIDVHNPDLVRPDGSPVVTDYRDFVGTGTDAPAAASESMGDAASIAAQGTQVHDLAAFGTEPAGCTIRVRGVAPDASVVALKVTDGRSFYDSTLVEAVDYAVQVAHVDVLNESLADDAYPDTGADPLTLANAAAVAAGVTVTAASGDAGPNSTIGAPASSVPGSAGIISTGATTQLQLANQVGYYGPGASVDSGNIAGFSSDGFAQTGRTVDVVAPGYSGWSVCTDDPTRYLDCPDFPDGARGLQAFSGTSESAPLTAGAAALVIDRYRATHDGASPTPSLVKRIISSTADDIGAPAQEQGAGEVDALRAVQLAGAVRGGSAPGGTADVLLSPSGRTLSPRPGHPGRASVTLTNPSDRTRRLVLSRRSPQVLGVARRTATVPDAHVVAVPFTVAPGADRISVTVGLRSTGGDYPELVLVGPGDVVANDIGVEGPSNTTTAEADRPVPGAWRAVILTYAYAGAADLDVTSYRNVSRVVSHVTVAAGRRRTVSVPLPASGPGDHAFALTLRGSRSASVRSSVPVVVRTPVTVHRGAGRFDGVVGSGNGRGGALYGTSTFLLQVPAGRPALRVRVRLAHGGERIDAYLTSPSGDELDEEDNLPPGSSDPTAGASEVDLATVHPQAGLWQVALGLDSVTDPAHPSTAFVGRVTTDPAPIGVSGLPRSVGTTLGAGVARTATVHLTNSSSVTRDYVVDPRLAGDSWQTLDQPGTVTISATTTSPVASVAVPPQTRELSSTMTAAKPLAGTIAPASFSFDGSNSDPEVYDTSSTGTLRLDVRSRELQDGPWLELPNAAGPFSARGVVGPVPVHLHASVLTRTFDLSVRSSTGDPWTAATGRPQDVHPLRLPPGASADITVTITPSGPVGRKVHGTLSVLGWDPSARVSSTQARFAYAYRVG